MAKIIAAISINMDTSSEEVKAKYMGDQVWTSLAEEYKELKAVENTTKIRLAQIKEKLVQMSHGDKSIGNSILLVPTKGRTTWAYKDFLKDENLNIPDKYKKEGKPSMTVRILEDD